MTVCCVSLVIWLMDGEGHCPRFRAAINVNLPSVDDVSSREGALVGSILLYAGDAGFATPGGT